MSADHTTVTSGLVHFKSAQMGNCCGGEESDRDKLDGSKSSRNPLSARKNICCTDVIFLLLFLCFWGLLGFIAVHSIINGDAKRLFYGYDSFGNTCNQQYNRPIENLSLSGMNTLGKPNVFFMSVSNPLESMQVCVSRCPNESLRDIEDVKRFTQKTNISLCRYDVDVGTATKDLFTKTGPCPEVKVYNSFSLLYRCVPYPDREDLNKSQEIIKKFVEVFELDDLFRKVLNDVYVCWREMLALCGIAVIIAFLVVLVMRFLASIVVWLIVILAIIGSLVGSGFLWWTWFRLPSEGNQVERSHIPIINVDVKNKTTFLVFSITATVLTAILLLILLVMRKRIALVVALFHEAGKCLVAIPLLLIQPLWTFVALFIFLVYWVWILAYIATLGTPAASRKFGFDSVEYKLDAFPKQFWWIHVIGLIWTSEFILACQQFVIASAVANWYFCHDKKRLSCPLGGAVNTLILHHLGSISLGSFIITLVKIPRYILMYIQEKCKASDNACAKCCLKSCICCLWCLEKLLKFLNQNAYTIIAIEGSNFCSAAQKAFGILTSNVLRVAAINSVGVFVLFLGKVGVMASTCAIAIVWLKSIGTLHYFAIPVFFVSVFSFLIAHCFLSVYEMVVDALLMCFCEDSSINDGSPGREYFMSTSLKEFISDSSRRMENLEKSHKASSGVDASENTELSPRH